MAGWGARNQRGACAGARGQPGGGRRVSQLPTAVHRLQRREEGWGKAYRWERRGASGPPPLPHVERWNCRRPAGRASPTPAARPLVPSLKNLNGRRLSANSAGRRAHCRWPQTASAARPPPVPARRRPTPPSGGHRATGVYRHDGCVSTAGQSRLPAPPTAAPASAARGGGQPPTAQPVWTAADTSPPRPLRAPPRRWGDFFARRRLAHERGGCVGRRRAARAPTRRGTGRPPAGRARLISLYSGNARLQPPAHLGERVRKKEKKKYRKRRKKEVAAARRRQGPCRPHKHRHHRTVAARRHHLSPPDAAAPRAVTPPRAVAPWSTSVGRADAGGHVRTGQCWREQGEYAATTGASRAGPAPAQ